MNFPTDHDLHCHSLLSSCSSDPKQTTEAILAHAKRCGYTSLCVTDHLWDNAVPGASGWYAPQDIAHVRKALPLPTDPQVKMFFGCETEFCGGDKLGLAPKNYDKFDFIVIPPNHFHMRGFVRPKNHTTATQVADLLVERLEEISRLNLPWEKVGIAHMTCSLTFAEEERGLPVFDLVDERRFRKTMRFFAKSGAGIELNMSSFYPGWREEESRLLRLYRMAKEEGCKFYLASDAHHPEELDFVPQRAPEVVKLLGLTDADLFRIVPAERASHP